MLALLLGEVSSTHDVEGKPDVQVGWLRQIAHTLADDAYTHLQPAEMPDWPTLAQLGAKAQDPLALLRQGLAQRLVSEEWSLAWLWLLCWLCILYRQRSALPELRMAVLWLLIELMRLRRKLIMDGQGLTWFVEYFGDSWRKASKDQGRDYSHNFRQLLAGEQDYAEIKCGPSVFKAAYCLSLTKAANQWLEQQPPQAKAALSPLCADSLLEQERYVRNLERWHFCLHFIRSGKQHRKNKQKELWKEAKKLDECLYKQTEWNVPEFLDGFLNPLWTFQPSRWVRGLDVAGDENLWKIEVFAPMLRWLRRGLRPLPADALPTLGFHLSVHAGEDYAHPVSGMRHIDETVQFCEMHDGDRLGHALALGIAPAQWAERQGDMLLPVDEHLDNLVWLWHYACELSSRLPLAAQVLPGLARRVARFVRHLPWLNGNSTPLLHAREGASASDAGMVVEPDTLWRAWRLRRNCHYQLRPAAGSAEWEGAVSDSILALATPDWRLLNKASQACALPDKSGHSQPNAALLPATLYLKREAWLALPDSERVPLKKVRVRAGEPLSAAALHHDDPEQGPLQDHDSPAELEFMHALQDYLLDQYDRQGILIEANPTSNVYIARLQGYHEHPIFRWAPPDESVLRAGAEYNRHGLRRGPMRVLVNTDDPGIMPTTLRTEYALLREAAIDLGISRTVAETWLERLRELGVDQFLRNHQPVFTRR